MRGLRTKTQGVFLNTQSLPHDVFAISETWLNGSFNSEEIFSSNFNVFRHDRIPGVLGSRGGGVLIAVRQDFNCSVVTFPPSSLYDFICVKLIFNQFNIFIVNCYISSSLSLINKDNCLNDCLARISEVFDQLNPCDRLLVLGDFNLPKVVWEVSPCENFLIPSQNLTNCELNFFDGLSACGLFQINATRNSGGCILDLVFTSDPEFSSASLGSQVLCNPDIYHPPLNILLSLEFSSVNDVSEANLRFSFRRTDFAALNMALNNIDFTSQVFNNDNINICTYNFYAVLFSCLYMSTPIVHGNSSHQSPPWYNKDLTNLKSRRNRAWKKYIKSKSSEDYLSFCTIFEDFKTLLSTLYNEYLVRVRQNIFVNPRSFFNFINCKKKSDGYPAILEFKGSSSSDVSVLTNFFASFFSEIYDVNSSFYPDSSYISSLNQVSGSFNVNDIALSREQVLYHLQLLDDDSSFGPDGIPAIVLKNCADLLVDPLCVLFNLSLQSGVFPELWKKSFITPIFKKGSRSKIENYRPVAKLSCIPKLFEKILYGYFYSYLSQFINSNQHGFQRGKSTTTILTEFVSDTLNVIERGSQVDVIFTDFSKAFDKVPYSIVLAKHKSMGFSDLSLRWLESYLVNRQYQVLFRSSISEPFLASSGVPQGSHLGPLCFIVSVNDVFNYISFCQVLGYADDFKLRNRIGSVDDCRLLQQDINSFSRWCSSNGLVLNSNKCSVMSFSRKNVSAVTRFNYYLDSSLLNRVESVRDLGVILDCKLTFKPHYDLIINKANSTLGFVKRWSKEFDDPYVTKHLYVTFVRPILEYASQVWSPFRDIDITRIESIQRKFLRFALRHLAWEDPLRLPPYENRLLLIDLRSLKDRRFVADVVFVHQIINGAIISPNIRCQMSFRQNHNNLRVVNLFNVQSHNTDYGFNEPISRMLREVNSKSEFFDISISKNVLKSRLYSQCL